MNELLSKVLDAHGGLARWNRFASVKARIVTRHGPASSGCSMPARQLVWLGSSQSDSCRPRCRGECRQPASKVRDVCDGDQVASGALVVQHKTQRPVQFEITSAAREAVQEWIKLAGLKPEDFLFPSRRHDSPRVGTCQYARIRGRRR